MLFSEPASQPASPFLEVWAPFIKEAIRKENPPNEEGEGGYRKPMLLRTYLSEVRMLK